MATEVREGRGQRVRRAPRICFLIVPPHLLVLASLFLFPDPS